ncbi:enediyne polyketide synthase [Gammaproteobacteria bacterium]
MSDVPASHWLIEDYFDPNPDVPDKTYVKRGGFLGSVPFDPMTFGIPPNLLPSIDSAQLLALLVAKRVLDEASHGQFDKLNPERISVILGATGSQKLMVEMGARLQRPIWAQALRELGHDDAEVEAVCARIASLYVPFVESTFPGMLGNVIAGRIANRFNLGGTNCVTDAACASSLAALAMGLAELELGHSDLVITGGVDTINDPLMFLCFSKTPALSPTGDCRPFSAEADGTMLGEGLVMFALKRLTDAERDMDKIYAVIRGLGTSSDGRALSVYAPRPEGQERALRRAYEAAGYGPETIELLEAHGTGTKAGDIAEFAALTQVFDETERCERPWCALGSVKSQIGHTKATAGAAGMAKVVLALHHKVLPPTIKVSKPNPQLQIEKSAFYLNTKARPWIRSKSHPRRASVSSFGFGGSNFHVTLEEYSGSSEPAPRLWMSPTELVLLGADTGVALTSLCREAASTLADDICLNTYARRSQQLFNAAKFARVALIVANVVELRQKLEQAAEHLERSSGQSFSMPSGIYAGFGACPGSLAFLFPGQGSQYVGMGADLAKSFDVARCAWDEALSTPLADDIPLHDVVFPQSAFDDETRANQAARLTATEWAQPAIGVASIALLRVLQMLGLDADQLGGHSFRELTALHAANTIEYQTFLRIARKRGELMHHAATRPGTMLAVTGSAKDVAMVLTETGIDVVIANDNGPRQVVLSGILDAIAQAEAALRMRGFNVRRIPVSTAFHSPILSAAREPFLAFLANIHFTSMSRPVYSNLDAGIYPNHAEGIRTRLADQIVSCVRFTDMIEGLYADGVRTFVEVGPGNVLTRLVEQILDERVSSSIVVNLDRKEQNGLTALWHGLGRLAVAGYRLKFDALWSGYALEPEQPASMPKFAILINGSNYGRSYPDCKRDSSRIKPKVTIASKNTLNTLNTLTSLSDAHAAVQRTLSDGHANYLRAMESSFTALCKAAGTSFEVPQMPDLSSFTPVAIAPVATALSVHSPACAPPSTPPDTTATDPDIAVVLIDIVAEKTGYPKEMLKPEMSLEGDLGIDSIKRVEIFSALGDRIPSLPRLVPANMALLRTLAQITEHLRTITQGVVSGMPGVTNAPAELTQEPAMVPRAVVVEMNARASGHSIFSGKLLARVVVTEDGSGVRQHLIERLHHAGFHVQPEKAVSAEDDVVIFLGGLRAVQAPEDAFAIVREAFAATRIVAPHMSQHGGIFVTVQDTGGDFGLSGHTGDRAWLAGLTGLAKTAALEWTSASVKAIDVDCRGRPASDIAAAIATELLEGGAEIEVGLHTDGRRTTLTAIPSAGVTGSFQLPPRSVVVVSGGARGVTVAALQALARVVPLRFVLFGRTPLHDEPECVKDIAGETPIKRALLTEAAQRKAALSPAEIEQMTARILAAREVRAGIASLENLGSEAWYIESDMRDHAAVGAALETVRRTWGPIVAMVHAAGVLADKRLAEKTEEQFERVFSTKVMGLFAMLEATRNDELKLLCLFSSVVARSGNLGQSDYALSNEILNRVAAAEQVRRDGRCVVRSLGWGPWETGMVTPSLRAHLESRGIPLIALENGAQAFVRELQMGTTGDVEILLGAGLDSGKQGGMFVFELQFVVAPAQFPFLESHRIRGRVVLPLVMAMEWFMNTARDLFPALEVTTCEDIRVLKGVMLAWKESGEQYVMRCQGFERAGEKTLVSLELIGEDGTRHYSARVALVARSSHWDEFKPANLDDGLFEDGRATAAYRESLFHGPHFRAIQSLGPVSESGLSGMLCGARALGWMDDAFVLDVPLMDGGLQMALVWGHHRLGQVSLPTRVGSFRIFQAGFVKGHVHAVLHVDSYDSLRTVSTVTWQDARGDPVAIMEGLEMHVI